MRDQRGRDRRSGMHGWRLVLLLALGIPNPVSAARLAICSINTSSADVAGEGSVREELRLRGGGKTAPPSRAASTGDKGTGGMCKAPCQQPWLLDKALSCAGRSATDQEGIRIAQRMLNWTLADMAMGMSARVMYVPDRTCTTCGSMNVRLGVTWRGMRQIVIGACEGSQCPVQMQDVVRKSLACFHLSAGVFSSDFASDTSTQQAQQPDFLREAEPDLWVIKSRGEEKTESSNGRGVMHRRFDGDIHERWAIFMCRRCAAGTGWDQHPSCLTTSKRCRFCVRRASYGADGGQMRHCRRHRAPGEVDLANAAKRCDMPECRVLVRYRTGRSGCFRTLCRKHALGQNSTAWKTSEATARKPVTTGGLVKKRGDPCTSMNSGKSAEEERGVHESQARRESPAAMQGETEYRKRGPPDDSKPGNLPSLRVGLKAQQETPSVEKDGIGRSMASREGRSEVSEMVGKVPWVQPPSSRRRYPSQCCAFPEGCHVQPSYRNAGDSVAFCLSHCALNHHLRRSRNA